MTTRKAVELLERILKDNQLIEHIEGERKVLDPNKRGPKRKDCVVKHSSTKEETRRGKLRKDIRNARKRIGYTWSILKAAEIVAEPEARPMTNARAAEDTMFSSPVALVNVRDEGEEDPGELADVSDGEPTLPTGKTIARSVMSPSVPPEHTMEEEDRSSGGKDAVKKESNLENGKADTNTHEENGLVETQAVPENRSLSKSVHNHLILSAALMPSHRATRAPRRSIYTPDSGGDEDQPDQKRQEQTRTHTAQEDTTPSSRGPAGQMLEKATNHFNTTNLNNLEIQGKPASRQSVAPSLLSPVIFVNRDVFSSSEDDISDSSEDGDSSGDDGNSDVDVKLDTDDESSEDDDDDESQSSDVEVKQKMDDNDDDDGGNDENEDEDEDEDEDENEDEDEDEDGNEAEHGDVKIRLISDDTPDGEDKKYEVTEDMEEQTRQRLATHLLSSSHRLR
jgi:hypothetical protein